MDSVTALLLDAVTAFVAGWRHGWNTAGPSPVNPPVVAAWDLPEPTTHVLPADAVWLLLRASAELSFSDGHDPDWAASLVLAGLEWEALTLEVTA